MLSAEQIKDTLWKQLKSKYYKRNLVQLCKNESYIGQKFWLEQRKQEKVRTRKQNLNSKISLPQVHFRELILNTGKVKVDIKPKILWHKIP